MRLTAWVTPREGSSWGPPSDAHAGEDVRFGDSLREGAGWLAAADGSREIHVQLGTDLQPKSTETFASPSASTVVHDAGHRTIFVGAALLS